MKKLLLVSFLGFLSFAAKAQKDTAAVSDPVFTSVDVEAKFSNDPSAWRQFLIKNLNGQVASDNGARAGTYTVVMSFVVNKDGSIRDIKADNDPGYGMVKEVTRVLKLSPNWVPATINNKPVVSRKKQPFTFEISVQ